MLSQSTYIFAAKVIGYGIRILLPAFLVRTLTKSEFGPYNQFFLLEIMFQTVFQLGVNQAQYYFIPKDTRNAGAYYINSISLNVVQFLVSYALIGIFRHQIAEFLQMPVLIDLYWHLCIYTILLMLQVCSTTYMNSRKFIKQSAAFDVATQVVVSIATLVAAYLTRDLRSIITALIAARFVMLICVLLFVHFKLHGFRSERYFFGIKEQFLYGVTLGLAGMMWTFMMRMHEMSVSKFFDLETYAVYAAGCKQIPVLLFFSQAIGPVALVKIAQLESENNWAGIKKFWERILGTMYGVGIPITVFFIVVADPLVTLMFTAEYRGAILIFQLNSLAMLYQILNPTLVLRAMNRNDVTLKVQGGILLLLPVALYIGKSVAGIYGIMGAHAIMLVLSRVISVFVLNRLTPVKLAYVPRFSVIWQFYRDAFAKGRSVVERLTG